MKKLFISIILVFICFSLYAQTSKQAAFDIVRATILQNNTSNINLYESKNLISPNTIIPTMSGSVTSPNSYSWMFFVDDAPRQNWAHQARFVFVSQSGQTTVISHNYPPSFGNMDILIEQTLNVPAYNPTMYAQNGLSANITAASSEHQYAVIINGGYNKYNNHERYWNDCAAIYSALIKEYGYDKSHIYVLMSDGTSSAVDRHRLNGTYDSSPLDLDGDGVADIQYAATKANITTVFNTLSNIMTNSDNLFIYTMDHGGKEGSNEFIALWNEEKIFDYQFAEEVNKIQARTINIVMGQCNSGGFIGELSGNNRVIATASTANQSSWSMTDLQFDEFVYYWTSAIAGHTPLGAIVNADSNSDGVISMQEAFNYAVAHDTANETPQYYSLPSNLGINLSLSGMIQCSDILINNKTYPSALQNLFGIRTFNISGCNIEMANTTINGNATVNIRAREKVTLKRGFWAKSGSNVSIKINPAANAALAPMFEATDNEEFENEVVTSVQNPVEIFPVRAIKVYSLTGIVMYSSSVNFDLQSTNLQDGIYIVEKTDAGGNLSRKKVILRR